MVTCSEYRGMLADGGDGEGHADPGSRSTRLPWEIQEIVAVGLLAVIAILAVTGLASGIAVTNTGIGSFGGQSLDDQHWANLLLYATRWNGAYTAFILLSATGLVWWQVDGWVDRLIDLEDVDVEDGTSDGDDVVEAVKHLARNKGIATWIGVLLVVTSLAAIGSFVGVVLQYTP